MPSLLMVLSFMANLSIGLFDPLEMPVPKEFGLALLVLGSLFFVYVLFYLRRGFFGETEPRLDFLLTEGPYNYCRHPQYLSFIVMILGLDLMFRSVLGVFFTLVLSIPSVVYRARVEDRLLRNRFGDEWEEYSKRVGFLFPKLRRE